MRDHIVEYIFSDKSGGGGILINNNGDKTLKGGGGMGCDDEIVPLGLVFVAPPLKKKKNGKDNATKPLTVIKSKQMNKMFNKVSVSTTKN